MAAYLAHIRMNLRLTFRDKSVLFFNYLFPLIFFFIFAQMFHAEQGGAIIQVATMVLCVGILGTGFFGAGMRAVADREQNILRRFKVAPITAGPILVSSLVTGLVHYIPIALFVLALSHYRYGMAWPERPLSLLFFIAIGVTAFRGIGLIIASVVNSLAESQILVQLLYFPMLFLSGTTIPITVMPTWVQVLAQFLPATYLFTGMQAIMSGRDSLANQTEAVVALLLTSALSTFIGVKLFRWEKDEKIRNSAKVWVVLVMAPFLVLGVLQAHSRDNIVKAKILARDERRSRTLLVRGARIFTGAGGVIESGAVLIRGGKIAEVYSGSAPSAKELNAEPIEASGKTLLPGLIDVHVHLGAPGGVFTAREDYLDSDKNMRRELAAYLYSGITAVKTVGDALDGVLKVRGILNSGESLGAELFVCGPMFTTEGGHGTEILKYAKEMPEAVRAELMRQMVRLPKTPEEARAQVDDLKKRGVDGIKAILEAGAPGMLFQRMDVSILRAVSEQAHADKLPIVVHTGDSHDVEDALSANANGIEHGSFRDEIPDELFDRMKQQGAAYDPTLMVVEAVLSMAQGKTDPLDRSLVQQVGPPSLIEGTKKFLTSRDSDRMKNTWGQMPFNPEIGRRNLLKAYQRGVMLVTGSDAGNMLVVHGPTIHRELQLWVEAGIPAPVALQAATYNAARLLGVENRIGSIQKGRDADLLLVDGNPLLDIGATERISAVIFKGERVDRPDLFEQQ
jgi:imidazolonepropionase-like amidohydrolase/ABC-type multidrug transport system permease subunit